MENGRELVNEEKNLQDIIVNQHAIDDSSDITPNETDRPAGDISSEPSAVQTPVSSATDTQTPEIENQIAENQPESTHVSVESDAAATSVGTESDAHTDTPATGETVAEAEMPSATAPQATIPDETESVSPARGSLPSDEHLDIHLEEHAAEEASGEEGHHDDLNQYSKNELLQLLAGLQTEEDHKKVDPVLRQAKNVIEHLKEHEKQEALVRFVSEGGVEDDFEYRPDVLTQQIEALYRQLKDRRTRQIKDLEKSKEKNLIAKTALLERLRTLVDTDETQASIEAVKEIQKEWKATGSVAPQHGNNLWASYHALIERYYTNRSIYFELKELDRRKNLETKLEICEKAEKLAAKDPSNAVIKELNELHEEYRHVGPVPREEQDAVWHRFKAASDAVYARRREQLEGVKKEMDQNYVRKVELVAALEPFQTFDSQKISDWNEKTQAILEIQKQWNGIGPVTKEKAKEISREFWHAFKAFFHHKNDFFRKLEEYRAKNLQAKTQLCEQVEALLNSEELEKSADEVKRLQLEWKNIGPVPEKYKNQIFDRFKTACDAFFNRRRESRSETDRHFEENLVRKMEVCQAIEDLAKEHDSDLSKLEALKAEWASIGFVPRKNMHSIQKRYLDAIHQFAKNADNLSGSQKEKVKFKAELDVSRNSPGAYKNIQQKEQGLRKRITQLENDIALWKNNIEFFSHSKTADKLREEFAVKISAAERELQEIKSQIRMMNEL